MAGPNHEFGRVSSLQADAVGQPGSRRFRLIVESWAGHSAVLWMEKEQLFNLAVALKQLIAAVEQSSKDTSARGVEDARRGEPGRGRGRAVEFQVGNLAISFDQGRGLYVIEGHEQEQEGSGGSPSSVTLHATQREVDGLADQAFQVCAAGRPRCRLCGGPMDPEGHRCPAHNGHIAAVI